ncbi:DUF4286 family protein [Pontibacter harenae]|uniref:DUF4286 family protein n=1 Tax=Pontibacter harenae TaxID=2894083 RepID=UPI001E607723|nr:DUF4286 family protein [Pontibacter harenae]MCC9168473.1 DUF4286 family protein [Pontibacter harenae]
MILYNVTVNIEHSVADEWLDWMQEVHIPAVMGTGYFMSNQICRLINEIDNGGTTFAVQYHCRNIEDLEEYQREHAPELDAKHFKRYEGKHVTFSSMLEIVAKDVERKNQ